MPQSFEGVLHEWKKGKLHSGTGKAGRKGKKVKSQKQALAIAFAEASREKEKN